MRLPAPLSRFLPAFVLALLFAANVAQAAANHVVISEFATRGPTAATDEFVELYNPTNAPIDISGWKLQYKSATGTTWNDRGVLPANTFIAAHGYFLIANQSYIGAVTPDFTSGAWNSGTGMADTGMMPGPSDVPEGPACADVADWAPAWAQLELDVLALVNEGHLVVQGARTRKQR